MEISKQPQDLCFNGAIVLTSLKCCIQKLLSQWVQSHLLSQPPPQLSISNQNAFALQVSYQGSVASAKLTHSFSSFPSQVHVKGLAQFAPFVQGGSPVHFLPGSHQLVDTH